MKQDGSITIAAPFGLDDLYSFSVRPSPRCTINPHFAAKAQTLKSRWPEITDSLAVHQQWRKLIVTHHVRGVQVHDARLVAAMDVHDVRRILTFSDTDFLRFSGIEVLHPRRLAAQYP